jgi:hypothetical protein
VGGVSFVPSLDAFSKYWKRAVKLCCFESFSAKSGAFNKATALTSGSGSFKRS